MADLYSLAQLGLRLREARGLRGLSLRALHAESGLAVSHLQRLERGQALPSPQTLRKLADPLRIPYEDLLRAAGYL